MRRWWRRGFSPFVSDFPNNRLPDSAGFSAGAQVASLRPPLFCSLPSLFLPSLPSPLPSLPSLHLLEETQGNLDNTTAMIQRHKEWHAATFPINAPLEKYLRKGFFFRQGNDLEGRPVLVVRFVFPKNQRREERNQREREKRERRRKKKASA